MIAVSQCKYVYFYYPTKLFNKVMMTAFSPKMCDFQLLNLTSSWDLLIINDGKHIFIFSLVTCIAFVKCANLLPI